jgi:hypothetical protein
VINARSFQKKKKPAMSSNTKQKMDRARNIAKEKKKEKQQLGESTDTSVCF